MYWHRSFSIIDSLVVGCWLVGLILLLVQVKWQRSKKEKCDRMSLMSFVDNKKKKNKILHLNTEKLEKQIAWSIISFQFLVTIRDYPSSSNYRKKIEAVTKNRNKLIVLRLALAGRVHVHLL